MNNTLKTDRQDVESIAAQLEYCIAPALESPQFKAPGWSSDLRHAAGVIRQLERERAENLRYRPALERIRDTSVAMLDSLRCYPKGGTVILAEGPGRIRDAACDALYPANAKRIRATD